jgi:hypothetical protein
MAGLVPVIFALTGVARMAGTPAGHDDYAGAGHDDYAGAGDDSYGGAGDPGSSNSLIFWTRSPRSIGLVSTTPSSAVACSAA